VTARATAAACVVGCGLSFGAVSATAAARQSVPLPSATAAVRTSPPLQARGPTSTERRVPADVDAETVVHVLIGHDGRPEQVTAVNRLLIEGTGDYSFAVPAPADDARPGPGSASIPGLREGTVLWQGFLVKRRVLSARITLRPRDVAPSLPLRVTVERGRVTIENATTTAVPIVAASARPAQVAGALDAARQALLSRRGVGPALIQVAGPVRPRRVRVIAPIKVTGVYRFGSEPVRRFSATIAEEALQLSGVVEPSEALRPPRGASWRAYAAGGGLGDHALVTAAGALLRSALAGQYEAFLANPDPLGRSSATYRYGLSDVTATVTANSPGDDETLWPAIALAIAAGLAFVTGAVAWAHS
jgi:hypothetical protein